MLAFGYIGFAVSMMEAFEQTRKESGAVSGLDVDIVWRCFGNQPRIWLIAKGYFQRHSGTNGWSLPPARAHPPCGRGEEKNHNK